MAALIIAVVLAAQLAEAWGGLGHRTVAYLAEKHFTPATTLMVESLLHPNHTFDISDAAVWPDGDVRYQRPWTKQWHFIDAQDDPPRTCGIKYKRDCNLHGVPGCIVSALVNMTGTLVEQNSTAEIETDALMFIIHLIGDIHQPLHTESLARGGNEIHTCFDGFCDHVNLHSIWDSFIPGKARGMPHNNWDHLLEKAAAKLWAEGLFNGQANSSAWQDECLDVENAQKCAMTWADESNTWVCASVLKPGKEWIEAHDLAGDYYLGAKPIVESLILKAGTRLAGWLNALSEYRNTTAASEGANDGLFVEL